MSDILFDCKHCGQNLSVDGKGSGREVSCPNCKKQIKIPTVVSSNNVVPPQLPPQLPVEKTCLKIKKVSFAGWHTILQIIGFFLLFVFPIGTVVGLMLMICGSHMGKYYVCGGCLNKIDKESKLCPTCKANLSTQKAHGSVAWIIAVVVLLAFISIMLWEPWLPSTNIDQKTYVMQKNGWSEEKYEKTQKALKNMGLSANEILGTSKELGMNPEAFQPIIVIFKQNGMSTDEVIEMLRKLKKSVDEIKNGDDEKLNAMQRLTGFSKDEIVSLPLERLIDGIAKHSFKKKN